MDSKIMEMNIKLLKEAVGGLEFLDPDHVQALVHLGQSFQEKLPFFHRCNQCIVEGRGHVELDDVEFMVSDDTCTLKQKNHKDIVLIHIQMRKVLSVIVDLLDPILPLGSVVDLRKEMFSQIQGLESAEQFRVVVTNRFLYYDEIPVYFPYAGSIYPVGNARHPAYIHFTPGSVERLVFRGYSDGADDAYIFEQKKELVLEKHKHSVVFAGQEELEALNRRIREE